MRVKSKLSMWVLLIGFVMVFGGMMHAQPDLKISIKCPGSARAGQELGTSIKVFVTNAGNKPAFNFAVDLILSKDTNIPVKFANFTPNFVEDCLLQGGREHIKVIKPGQTIPVKLNGNNKIPADTPTGLYHLGAVVDPGNKVRESNERNNTAYCRMKIQGKLAVLRPMKPVKPGVRVVKPIKPIGRVVGLACPDPAAIRIDFQIVRKYDQFKGRIRITGVVKNIGSKDFRSLPGQRQASAHLYEGIPGGSFTLRAQKPFADLNRGAEIRVTYERNWNISSPSEGEFPPTYRLLIVYDPDIRMDDTKDNDDCNNRNNKKERSGADIRSLF